MKVSTFNAKVSRVIIHVKAMKIYVATMEVIMKTERHDETQFPIKIG
jgi:bifunctional DNase/RNase